MKVVNPIVDVRVLRTRWLMTLALALGAGFLVVESYAFGASTAAGIGFAVSIAMTVLAAGLFATSRRAGQYLSVPARSLRVAAWEAIAAGCMAIAGWNIVQSLVFGASTARWLTFADGLGILALAVAGLTLHELSTERVVHSLEVVRDDAHATDERHDAHVAA